VDPEKMEAIRSSSMGLVGYYRRFIEDFSKIAHSITSLQKKGMRLVWNEKWDEDYVVCADACKEGFDGILTQGGHVICYESRKLKEHEVNYAMHGLELAAMVHALRNVAEVRSVMRLTC